MVSFLRKPGGTQASISTDTYDFAVNVSGVEATHNLSS